VKKAEIRE
jgi:hypothetical protein